MILDEQEAAVALPLGLRHVALRGPQPGQCADPVT
jgi:hypothetical protein